MSWQTWTVGLPVGIISGMYQGLKSAHRGLTSESPSWQIHDGLSAVREERLLQKPWGTSECLYVSDSPRDCAITRVWPGFYWKVVHLSYVIHSSLDDYSCLGKSFKKKCPCTWPGDEGTGPEQGSSKEQFCPRGHIWRQRFWFSQWERGCSRHLLGGGQGCLPSSPPAWIPAGEIHLTTFPDILRPSPCRQTKQTGERRRVVTLPAWCPIHISRWKMCSITLKESPNYFYWNSSKLGSLISLHF